MADRPDIVADASGFARAHPGLAMSGLYAAATAVGMLSSWTLYGQFGLNIFHYAQPSDFLLSAVRMPLATLAILMAIPAVLIIVRSDAWLGNRFKWYRVIQGPAWFRALNRTRGALGLYLIVYAYLFSFVYASRLATSIRAGESASVEVQLQGGTYLGEPATRPFTASLLGTTSAYVFLFDGRRGAVTVVPLENVASLTVR